MRGFSEDSFRRLLARFVRVSFRAAVVTGDSDAGRMVRGVSFPISVMFNAPPPLPPPAVGFK